MANSALLATTGSVDTVVYLLQHLPGAVRGSNELGYAVVGFDPGQNVTVSANEEDECTDLDILDREGLGLARQVYDVLLSRTDWALELYDEHTAELVAHRGRASKVWPDDADGRQSV